MYLMYVDESGDTGLTGSPTRYYALSGLVVHESDWRSFIDGLIAFRKKLKSMYGLPMRAEIHASEFINRRAYGLDRHVRLAILRNTLDELAKLETISITNVVVDKLGKPANFDVFHSGWGTLFQRFENTLQYGNFPGGYKTDHGMILTDATAGKKLSRLVRRMAVFNYIPYDARMGGGSRNIPITRVIEDPYSKDSRESLPIQMSDVVAYFLVQRFAPNAYLRRVRAHLYFDRLEPVLNKRASRYNPQGIVLI